MAGFDAPPEEFVVFDFVKRALARVVNEPAVVLGVVIAAVNATTDQSWEGYAAAVGAALLRFVVFGPLTGEKKA